MSEFEKEYIKKVIGQLLNCDLKDLPVQFITSKFLWVTRTEKEYLECMEKGSLDKIEHCSRILDFYCPNHKPELSLQRGCHALMSIVQAIHKIDEKYYSQFFKTSEIQKYKTCIEPSVKNHQKCLPNLTSICKRSKMRVYKAIRSTKVLTTDIYDMKDNSYIIYQIRDPRGIINSRISLKNLSFKVKKEAQRLCLKMLTDLRYFKQMQIYKKKRILIIRYEDVVTDIIKYSQLIYNFVDEPLPGYLLKELENSVHANITKEIPFFQTVRKNGTASAFKWQKSLSPTHKKIIDNECQTFLSEAGYKM